jgi:serine/threonine protein phosphatase 1
MVSGISGFFGKLLGRNASGAAHRPMGRIPDGERLYAIGDIHGRFDLLQDLHEAIEVDCKGSGQQRTIVYLGDYIDRGTGSRQVIDLLLAPADDDVKRVFLLGNHEAMLLGFLESSKGAGAWLTNGGMDTLDAYGVTPPGSAPELAGVEAAQRELQERLPREHLAFFQNLQLCHQLGDYYFVHAGVRPGLPLERQKKEDMIWIRTEFLEARENFPKIIVHGHSIRSKVEERRNRIGIDTGAYLSGHLTALVLESDQRRYLST